MRPDEEPPLPGGELPFTRLDAESPERVSWWRWVLDLDPFAPAVGSAARRDGRWAGGDGPPCDEPASAPSGPVAAGGEDPPGQSDRPAGAT